MPYIVYNKRYFFSIIDKGICCTNKKTKKGTDKMEIERKFLVKNVDLALNSYQHKELIQAYISTDPVIRIRRSNDNYYLTIKSGGLLKREEYEIPINESQFNNLLNKAEGNVIEKTRYIIPEKDNLKIELDIFHGVFEGLIYAEVEFPTEDAANSYTPPEFIYREVTGESLYQNSSLSNMNKEEIGEFLSNLFQ